MLRHHYSQQTTVELLSQDNTLCVVTFNGQCQTSDQPGQINTGLTVLQEHMVNEVWQTNKPVTRGLDGACQWNKSDDILCSAIYLDLTLDIETATNNAYTTLLDHIKKMGYPHPFRFWNYIPKINQGLGDDENYKKFCSGRLAAFQQHNIDQAQFPAASALGSHSNGAVVYVFSAKHKGQHFRNTKQIDAFAYPRQYGRSSPSFSRATSIKLDNTLLYMISGTASITGHQTIAPDDLNQQLIVTCENLAHLVDRAKQVIPLTNSLQPTATKVYVKHPDHLGITKDFINKNMPQGEYLYTLADICRDDLLVEIECHCTL